ncbi:MAG: L-threonylcarbamoyladenylate synthase [Comamonadaceae bacterium]|nr:L-threonylcarbamoyladenylate synthase [Comamonadaceae bacterium]
MILPPSESAIAQAIAALQQGQLLGLPTETVYGLAADACQERAVQQIFLRKGRPAQHPLIVHVADAAAAEYFAAAIPDFARALMAAFWPGPLTLILPRRPGVAERAAGGHATIGLRCPAHPVARQLLQQGLRAEPPIRGLAAPSANRFGRVSPTQAEHVIEELTGSAQGDLLVLDGGACEIGIESSIVDCSRAQPVLLRPGHVQAQDIARVTGLPVARSGAARDAQDDGAPQAPGTLSAHYAPHATVRLMDASAIQTALGILGAQGKHIAVYARTPMHSASRDIVVRRMPATPEAAAQELFQVLRSFDAQGVKLIWIEAVPDEPAWDGVRDRIERAAASASG